MRWELNLKWPVLFLFLLPLLSSPLIVAAQSSEPSDSSASSPKARDILRSQTPEAKLFLLRKYDFIRGAAASFDSTTADTNLVFQLRSLSAIPLYLTREELEKITPTGVDPIGEDIRRRFIDVPPTIALNQIFRSIREASKKPTPKLSDGSLPIPTNLEIDILKVLWMETVATPSTVYARLDTSWKITAEDLHSILEEMVNAGFLDRKQISPAHEFDLFGLAQFELSAKNRKNKVYLYWPIIPKDKLITYLDAKRFLAYESARERSTNGETDHYYKLLEEKLYRLVQ
jgi:hypothetical protein